VAGGSSQDSSGWICNPGYAGSAQAAAGGNRSVGANNSNNYGLW